MLLPPFINPYQWRVAAGERQRLLIGGERGSILAMAHAQVAELDQAQGQPFAGRDPAQHLFGFVEIALGLGLGSAGQEALPARQSAAPKPIASPAARNSATARCGRGKFSVSPKRTSRQAWPSQTRAATSGGVSGPIAAIARSNQPRLSRSGRFGKSHQSG